MIMTMSKNTKSYRQVIVILKMFDPSHFPQSVYRIRIRCVLTEFVARAVKIVLQLVAGAVPVVYIIGHNYHGLYCHKFSQVKVFTSFHGHNYSRSTVSRKFFIFRTVNTNFRLME